MIEELNSAITRSVLRQVENVAKFGILFSGGIDSALIAQICQNSGLNGELYTVGAKGSHDLEVIELVREHFMLKIRTKVLEESDIEAYAAKVMRITGFHDPVNVGIGIPLLAGFELAAKNGKRVVLAGQGADELFGGYYRYLKFSDIDFLKETEKDIKQLPYILKKRDYALARANSIELRLPYLDPSIMQIASQIPVDFKIRNGVRKYILREIAKLQGVPIEIIQKEKKAVQYSSGVTKVLRKLAKKKGKKLREYLISIYFKGT